MKCSLIIPTYNGSHKIGNLFDSLQAQSYRDFEIVVVVDGSTDNTVDIVESYRTDLSKLRLVVTENQGRSKTRNAGAQNSEGDLFIFIDDDVIADIDLVQKHIFFHMNNPGSFILTGTHRELPGETDIQKYRESLAVFWNSRYQEKVTKVGFDNLYFAAGNCSIPKTIFYQLGGFDERLLNVEDYDFAHRALKAGVPVFFNKEIMATHCDLISCKSYIRRQREYDEGKRQRNRINGIAERKFFVKHLLYRFFAFNFLVRLIDKNYFVILPKKMRYKIYDLVIHSLSVEYPTIQLS